MARLAMFIRWFAALAAASLLVAGCMATGGKAVAEMSEGKGVALLRVSVEGLKYVQSFGVLVRAAGTTDLPMQFRGWHPLHEEYWSRFYEDTEKGQLVAVSLPPGEYEIFGIEGEAGAWGGSRRASLKGFSARFRVDAGKAVYLGNVHVRFYGDAGTLPPHVRVKGYVLPVGSSTLPLDIEMRDTRQRDFAELPKRAPGLAKEQIEVRLLHF